DPIVLVRTESGTIFALEDRCAHRQVPLHAGVVEGEFIRCGYHPAPVSTTPAAKPETTPAPSATHFDPGYDPGYDVPALDSPTMMMAPAEDEETPAAEMEEPAGFDTEPAPAGPAPVDADIEQPAPPEALPETAAESDTGNAAQIPDENAETHAGPAEDSLAEPAPANQADAGPVAAANGKHHDGQGEQGSSAAILAGQDPWPQLDRSVLEDPEPSRPVPGPAEAEPSEERHDEPAGEPASETAAEPVLRSASEFLRTQTSDSTEAPVSVANAPVQASAPSTPRDPGHDSGHDHDRDHAHGHDYGPNYGPTYGASTGDAFSATAGAVARENATRRWTRQEPQMGPAFAPDFLRQTRERERARQAPATPAPPRFRFGWHIAATVLAVGVLLQGLYLMRGQLAGHFPVLRPALEAACAPLGCDVPPWRDIDALRIDTSQLQKQEEGSDTYLLAVTLRNQAVPPRPCRRSNWS
ncbi:hypothetical protein AWV80_25955, partial [Cupriavidus sp. UYMU48A]